MRYVVLLVLLLPHLAAAQCPTVPNPGCVFLRNTTTNGLGYKDAIIGQRGGGSYINASTTTGVGPSGCTGGSCVAGFCSGGTFDGRACSYPTTGIQVTQTIGGLVIAWITPPLDAITLSGNVLLQVFGLESPAQANTGPEIRFYKYTGGAENPTPILTSQSPGQTCLATGAHCTEFPTSAAQVQWGGFFANPVSFAAGDRLVIKAFINDAGGTNCNSNCAMTDSSRSASIHYDGPVWNADGDTYIQTTQALAAQSTPTPTITQTPTRTATRTATVSATPTVTETWTPDPTQPTPVPRAFIWSGASGTIGGNIWTLTGNPQSVSADGRWWLQFNPTTGIQTAERAVSGSGQSNSESFILSVGAFPPWTCSRSPSTPCTPGNPGQCLPDGSTFCTLKNEAVLMDTRGTFGTTTSQTLLTLSADTKLRLKWHDTDLECTANSLYRYTPCTTEGVTDECPSDVGGNPGEASCASADFAVSPILETNTPYRVAVQTTANTSGSRPYDVTQSLWLNGYKRGERTRWEGVCSNSTGTINTNGKACGFTTDCNVICTNINTLYGAGSCMVAGTCGNASIAAAGITSARFGQSVAARGYTVNIGDVVLVPTSSADPYVRYNKVVSLWPTTDAGPNAWIDNGSSACPTHALCVDDSQFSGLDDDVSHLMDSTVGDQEVWNLTDYTPAANEQVIGVDAFAYARAQTNAATLAWGLRDSGANSLSTSQSLTSLTYANYALPVSMSMPSGGAWSLNALKGFVQYITPGGSSFRLRVSNFVTDAEVALPAPPTNNYIPDLNSDGKKTVCVGGDSIMNDTPLYNAMNAALEEPDNIIRCAKGGRRIGDLEAVWSAMLDGSGSGDVACQSERGDLAHCDVMFLYIIANDVGGYLQSDDTGYCFQRGCSAGTQPLHTACAVDADCGTGGVCTDRYGSQQGAACGIPSGQLQDDATYWTTGKSYCTDGPSVGTCCAGSGCTPIDCGGPGGCVGGANANAACTEATKVADCGAGIDCAQWGRWGSYDLTDPTYSYGWCAAGSNRSPDCRRGVCMHGVQNSYLHPTLLRMLDVASARTGDRATKVILVGNADPIASPQDTCVAGANHGTVCTSDGNCPNGACRHTYNEWAWHQGLDATRAWGHWLRALADERGLPFVDANAYLRRISHEAGEDSDLNLHDGIHPNEVGQARISDLYTACLERDTSVIENHCNDLTTAQTCPTMLPAISDLSDANSDNIFVSSPECTTGTATQHVDDITVYVASTPGTAHIRCSVYGVPDGSLLMTKVNAACDTASTLVTQAGWVTMPTTTPASCALSAATTYWRGCITDDNALAWGIYPTGNGRFALSQTFENGMPATVTVGTLQSASYVGYLTTHSP